MKKQKTQKRLRIKPIKHARTLYVITPKFIHGIAVGAFVGVLLVGALRYVSMSYASNVTPSGCIVNPVTSSNGTGLFHSFSVSGNNVTETFSVKGPTGCSAQVSLVSWRAAYGATSILPFNTQVEVDGKTGVYKQGTYTLTVKVPDCYYQVDMSIGPIPAPGSGANYGNGNVQDFLQAGNTVCVAPVTVTVAKTPTPTPTVVNPAVATPQTPTTLVNTGPGAVIIIAVVASISGFLFHTTHRKVKHKRRTASHH